MLANAVTWIPETPGMGYEPKWNGFRVIAYVAGTSAQSWAGVVNLR